MAVLNTWAIKLIAICAAGIILNIIGTITANKLNLDIYLDTIGTVFIAVIGGYVPGIAVGFFTNLLASLFYKADMYFSLVNIIIAIITTFLASRGYYEKFSKVLLVIPIVVLTTSFTGAFIEEMLSLANSFNSWKSVIKIVEHFLDNFSRELPDKGVSILITFFALKFIPADVREQFNMFGRMQAPVSEEMRKAIKSDNKFVASLRTKMVTQLIFITIFIAGLISSISYTIFQDSSIKERIRIADGIITMAVNEINPKRVDDFIANGYKAEGYFEVEKELYKIRASNSDIKFLYVYKIMEDGCHVVFDLDTASVEASEPGYVEEFNKSFEEYLPDLLAGRPIPPIISNETYGYLLTIYKPVYNSEGKCVCYAGIDFSMDLINDYGRLFIAEVVALFSGALIFIFVLSLAFIENNILLPVNTMSYCAKNFVYDSEEARAKNIERIKSLNIKTKDEIENLYSAFVKTTEDSMHYFENFKRAKIEVEVMEELAHTDSLTRIKNKTAYTETTYRLDAEILDGQAEFAIVMIDINYLKRVNDTYGHERGNEYLINACELTCSIFGKENVYRVGGDEFVAVLDKDKIEHCEELIAQIRAEIEKFRADDSLEPWEKVSAAIGVAYYNEYTDKTTEEVFKRADADMYKNKIAMKANRRD